MVVLQRTLKYCTLGVPSIDTARRHVSTTPLVTSAGMPTRDEINANLAIGFEHQEVYGDWLIKMTMPIDEIKLQECLCWDPRTNMILGVCREHGGECVLEFRTMAQANHLVMNLASEQVHMASEVSHDSNYLYGICLIIMDYVGDSDSCVFAYR